MNNSKKVMLNVYNRALKKIVNLKLTDLKVDTCFQNSSNECHFIITAFDKCNNNISFYFYDFEPVNAIKTQVKSAIKKIKTGDIDFS